MFINRFYILIFLIFFSQVEILGAVDSKDQTLAHFDFKAVGDSVTNKTFADLLKESTEQKKNFFIIAVKNEGGSAYDYYNASHFLEHYFGPSGQDSRDAFEDLILMGNSEFKVYKYEGKATAEIKDFTLKGTYKTFYDLLADSEKLGAPFSDTLDEFLVRLKKEIFNFNRAPFTDIEAALEVLKVNTALYYVTLLAFPAYIDSKNYSENTKKMLKDEVTKLTQEIKKGGSAKAQADADTILKALDELEGKASTAAQPESAKPTAAPKKDDSKAKTDSKNKKGSDVKK